MLERFLDDTLTYTESVVDPFEEPSPLPSPEKEPGAHSSRSRRGDAPSSEISLLSEEIHRRKKKTVYPYKDFSEGDRKKLSTLASEDRKPSKRER